MLEGQAGADTLYGGGGIDKLILDVNPLYALPDGKIETFAGHYGNETSENDAPDDNATDILVVMGDTARNADDTIAANDDI